MTTIAPVSVVIPCFQCVRTLERAVASVAGQTVLPLELILVDDGSGDETRALMTHLQSRNKTGWIKLVMLDTNVGAASARNAGWDEARGDFVAFLDAGLCRWARDSEGAPSSGLDIQRQFFLPYF